MKGRNLQSPSSANLSGTKEPFLSMGILEKALPDVIQEEGLIVKYLTNKMSGQSALFFENTQHKFGRDDHLAMLMSNVERRHMCFVFTCMQLALTIGGLLSVHPSGNFSTQFYHEWICAFLVLAKAPKHHIFLPYTTIEELLIYSLLFMEGVAKITAMLRQNRLMHKTEVYLSSGEIGCARSLGKANSCNAIDPVWFVITPADPNTKVSMTEQACCSELITAICTQLQ
jgi:hypothetical protein